MKSRPKDIVTNNHPGPGAYQASEHIVKDRVISHKISKSERVDIVSREAKNLPGPGVYDSPHKIIGKDAQSVCLISSNIVVCNARTSRGKADVLVARPLSLRTI